MRLLLLTLVPACAVSTAVPGRDPVQPAAKSPAVTEAPPAAQDGFGTCDAAHDHCLRHDTWFVSEWDGDYVGDARPAYRHGDEYLEYERDQPMSGRGHRTVAATVDTVVVGATVVVFEPSADLPRGEEYALEHDWRIGTVGEVDVIEGAFRYQGKDWWIPLDGARVVVESR